MIWLAGASWDQRIPWRLIQKSKKLTKVFRHGWNQISHNELVSFKDLVAHLNSRNYSDIGKSRSDWESMIHDSMLGVEKKPRVRWCFRVPESEVGDLD